MLEEELIRELENACIAFVTQQLAIDYLPPIPFAKSNKNTLISWEESPKLSYLFRSPAPFNGTSSIEQYLTVLRNRDFTLLLDDGAVIQISYMVKDNNVRWHRLFYYPCPIAFAYEELTELSILELFEVFNEKTLLSRVQNVSPIRFDFDADFSDEVHAHCHATIGKKCCRIPVYGPISINQFFNFIISNYYSDRVSWKIFEREIPFRTFPPTLNSHHNNPLYFNCTSALAHF